MESTPASVPGASVPPPPPPPPPPPLSLSCRVSFLLFPPIYFKTLLLLLPQYCHPAFSYLTTLPDETKFN